MKKLTFVERFIRKLSQIRFVSVNLPVILYQLNLYSLAKIASKYSKFVPTIVDFQIVTRKDKTSKGKLYGIHESSIDNITKRIWIDNLENYEKPMPQVFLNTLEQAQQLLDVGANSGLYSIIAALSFPDLMIHAFEPFPTALKCLESNIELNNSDQPIKKQIKIIKNAVGNTLGTAQLYIPIPRFGAILETSASLNSEFRDQHSEILTVDLITLDQYVAEAQLQSVDVIKIDVESQEYKVLDGSRNILKDFRPIIFLEVLEEADIISLESIRSKFNYISLWLAEEAIIQKDKVSSHPDIQNQVLCPAEKIQKFHDIAIALNLDFIDES